jgi:hypothetical protein
MTWPDLDTANLEGSLGFWDGFTVSNPNGVIDRTSDQAHSGDYSIRITCDDSLPSQGYMVFTTPGAVGGGAGFSMVLNDADKNKIMRMGFYGYTESTEIRNFSLEIYGFDEDGNYLGGGSAGSFGPSELGPFEYGWQMPIGQWQRFSNLCFFPPEAVYLECRAYSIGHEFYESGTDGLSPGLECYWDDFFLESLRVPNLRQRQRDDGVRVRGASRNAPSSRQSSVRQGWANTYV